MRSSTSHLTRLFPRSTRPPTTLFRRFQSTQPSPDPSNASKPHTRISRMISRLPTRLQPHLRPLLSAPLSHLTSFLLLHELTAILPLLALAGAFHYTNYLPPYFNEGAWVAAGVEKFGNYFRRKGWLGKEGKVGEDGKRGRLGRWWGKGEGRLRLVLEIATAWGIVKALLPVRIVFSVWVTPAFARGLVIPVGRAVGRLFGRGGKRVVKGAGVGGVGVGIAAKEAAGTVGEVKKAVEVGREMDVGARKPP